MAIPTDMAKPIMNSLLEHGKVVRGWLGVGIQDLDKELASGLGISVDTGVLVSDVALDSPAATAGLKRGDVILEFAGEPVSATSELRNRVATAGPDAEVKLLIMRDGKRQSVSVTLGKLEDSSTSTAAEPSSSSPLSGLRVAPVDREARARYEISKRVTQGVVVTGVAPGSVAQRAGIRVGDVIQQVNRRAIDSVATFNETVADAGDTLVLLVSRGNNSMFLSLRR